MLWYVVFTPHKDWYVVVIKPCFLRRSKVKLIQLKQSTKLRAIKQPLVNRICHLFLGRSQFVDKRTRAYELEEVLYGSNFCRFRGKSWIYWTLPRSTTTARIMMQGIMLQPWAATACRKNSQRNGDKLWAKLRWSQRVKQEVIIFLFETKAGSNLRKKPK